MGLQSQDQVLYLPFEVPHGDRGCAGRAGNRPASSNSAIPFTQQQQGVLKGQSHQQSVVHRHWSSRQSEKRILPTRSPRRLESLRLFPPNGRLHRIALKTARYRDRITLKSKWPPAAGSRLGAASSPVAPSAARPRWLSEIHGRSTGIRRISPACSTTPARPQRAAGANNSSPAQAPRQRLRNEVGCGESGNPSP